MSSMLRRAPRVTHTNRTRRRAIAVGFAISALALASQAAASSPRTFHGTFTEAGSFTDDAACGFPVTFSFDTRVVFNDHFDANGNFVQTELVANGTATESANGMTLTGKIEDNAIFFTRTQQVYEVGLVDTLKLPGGGVVQIDVGRLVWSFDAWFGGGAPTVVEGPHQALAGDDAALCAALTP